MGALDGKWWMDSICDQRSAFVKVKVNFWGIRLKNNGIESVIARYFLGI